MTDEPQPDRMTEWEYSRALDDLNRAQPDAMTDEPQPDRMPGLANAPGEWRWEQRGDKWWRIHDVLNIEDGPHNQPDRMPVMGDPTEAVMHLLAEVARLTGELEGVRAGRAVWCTDLDCVCETCTTDGCRCAEHNALRAEVARLMGERDELRRQLDERG
jgi:hypothetical protein